MFGLSMETCRENIVAIIMHLPKSEAAKKKHRAVNHMNPIVVVVVDVDY